PRVKAALGEVVLQPLRGGRFVDEGDVTGRPDEIRDALPESGGPPQVGAPGKGNEWQAEGLAFLGEVRGGFAVDMDLPPEGRERGEVVLVRARPDPGEAISTPEGTRRPRAQGTVAIVEADLRQGP